MISPAASTRSLALERSQFTHCPDEQGGVRDIVKFAKVRAGFRPLLVAKRRNLDPVGYRTNFSF